MAKTVQDSRLHNRTSRATLEARSKPYWLTLHEGLHLGYRKGKRGGRWSIRYYAGDGDYRTRTIATADDVSDADGVEVLSFRQAQSAAREMATDMAAQRRGVHVGPYTVAKALEDYFEAREGNSYNVGTERKRAAIYIEPLIGHRRVDDLNREELKKWRDKVAAMPRMGRSGQPQKVTEPASPEEKADRERARKDSANRILTILKAALNHAYDEGRVPSDNAWRRLSKFRTTTKARVRYLTMAEVERFINVTDGDFRNLVRGALLTGARYGDLIAMDVGDYVADNGLVMCGNSKGSKPYPVYLTAQGAKFFDRLTAGRSKAEPMFLRGDRRWRRAEQARPMREANFAASIDPPIGFHQLRHTYASHAVMGNVPLLVVAQNLGHSDTRMVEAHYGHLSPSYKADAIRAGLPQWGGEEDETVEVLRRGA